MASNCQGLGLSSSSQGMKGTEDEKLPMFNVSPTISDDVHISVSDGVSSPVSRPAAISHPQQRLQSAKLMEKDVTTSSPSVSLSTKSVTMSSETRGFSETFDQIKQSFEHNTGPTRGLRNPVIAWGAEDSRGTRVSAAKSGAGRRDSQPSRRRPASCSEVPFGSTEPPSSRESLVELQDYETLPDNHKMQSAQDSRTKERKPKDREKADVVSSIFQRWKHPSTVQAGKGEKKEDDAAFSQPASSASRAWKVPEDRLRSSQDLASPSQPPPHLGPPSIRASSTFQDTMVDLFGYPDYSHPPPPFSVCQIASKNLRVNGALNKFFRSRRRCAQAEGSCVEGKGEVEVDALMVDSAQRGWQALRSYLQEQGVSKRTSPSALNWTMLAHTVKGMATDQDKTRQDLYRRYGIIPSEDANGNVVMVNTMLSDRARKTSTGSRQASTERAMSARSPERGDPARGVWIPATTRRHHAHTKHLSSSLPAMFSPPSSSSSSAKLSDDFSQGGRPGGSSRVRRMGVVRPHSSVGAGTKGSGAGLLPLRKISAPTFRASRSLDS
ncbi:hypothetical protein ACOMHN_013502 [Nucella lapillus]